MQKPKPRADVLLWILLACSNGASVPEQTELKKEVAQTAPLPSPTGPGIASLSSVQLPQSSGTQFAIDTLSKVVDLHARDPKNPWAIGHGLVALGSPLELSNGSDAVQWLFSQYAERTQVGNQWVLRFPKKDGNTRIEPHADLLLKALTDAGVPPSTPIEVKGHAHTVGDLYKGSLSETWFRTADGTHSFDTSNDIPWSLFGLASWSGPGQEWTSQNGHTSSADDWANHTMDLLIKETRFLDEAKKAKRDFQKQGQGIFQYTCGGAHLLQGVAHATLKGFGSTSNRALLKEQLHLLLYRFPIELGQIDAGEKQHPDFKLPLRVQRLKLTGHTLETLYRLSATDLVGEQDRKALEQVAAEVVKSVVLLQETGALVQLESIRAKNEQLYLDIVGDSAHALRGLRIATGQSSVYY